MKEIQEKSKIERERFILEIEKLEDELAYVNKMKEKKDNIHVNYKAEYIQKD